MAGSQSKKDVFTRGSAADKNSAVILSLWHCKVTWFLANHDDKIANRLRDTLMTHEEMETIYGCMTSLRLAITTDQRPSLSLREREKRYSNNKKTASRSKTVNRQYEEDIIPVPEIAKHFNNIVLGSGISNEVWTEELHSLMEEIVSISHVLRDYQHRLLVEHSELPRTTTTSTLRDGFYTGHIHDKPRFTVTLLTLCYWLLVWCFPNDDSQDKKDFLEAIESNSEMLARCLFSTHQAPMVDDELEKLFTMLLDILNSDLQQWIDALDRFTGNMVHAGILRGQLMKVFNVAHVLKHGGSMPTTLTTMAVPHKDGLVMSLEPKFLSKAGELKRIVGTSLMDTSRSETTDLLHDVIVNVSHGIKGGVDNAIDRATGIVDDFSHEIFDGVAKKINNGFDAVVHGPVAQLGHIIGNGIHLISRGTISVANKVGHFFSSIF